MTENLPDDDLGAKIEKLLPKCLDDVIRLNRDQARLYLTTDEEIMSLHEEVTPGQPKRLLDDWRFISLKFADLNEPYVMLIGNSSRTAGPKITSNVRQIDLDRGFVVTNNSLYQLGKKGQGEPPTDQIYFMCAAFNDWGFGAYFGVPPFFL